MKNFYCRITITVSILLLLTFANCQAQNVSISANKTSGCVPLLVSFSATLDPGYTSYEWTFDQGAGINNMLAPMKTFDVPKTYKVNFTAVYPSGPVTRTLDVVVHDVPAPSFTGPATDACQFTTLAFTDNSTTPDGNITSIEWDMGDGTLLTTEQGKTVSHKFNASGTYNVSSIAINNWGCRASSAPIPVRIRTAPDKPDFQAVKASSCTAPFDVMFINKTPDPNKEFTFTYDYGDGTTGTSATHQYSQPGKYSVTLTATNGDCQSSNTITDYISIGNLKASFTYSNSCMGQTVQFTNTSTPAPSSSIWTFPDGSTATTQDATHGIGVSGQQVVLSVTLDGCSDVVILPITMYDNPTDRPTVTPNNTCQLPTATRFTVTNSNATSWSWTFDDGTPPSTEQNPVHTFTQNRAYNVVMNATTDHGCTVSLPLAVDYSLPTVEIMAERLDSCLPFNARLSTRVTGRPYEPVVDYNWNFGDGTTGTGPNPTHLYTTEGIFNVVLTFTTANGCQGTSNITLRAGRKPVVDFTATPLTVCAKDPVQFTNRSVPPGQQWLWTFLEDIDDPRTPQNDIYSSVENPEHYFRAIGLHDVRLIVDNYGCRDTLIKTDYINVNPPIAEWATTVDCTQPAYRKFTDMTNWGNNPGAPKNYLWDFGDGTTSTDPGPAHTYTKQGRFYVSLKVNNGDCDNEFGDSVIIVNQTPAITTNLASVCVGKSLTLTATIPADTLQQGYFINWGDGTQDYKTGWDQPALHQYNVPGEYKVQVKTTDLNNCVTESSIADVTVNGPIPDFTFTGKLCRNSDILFTDKSGMNTGNALTTWNWNFGDNSTDVSATTPPVDVAHQYTRDGSFPVTLTVTDKFNCAASITKQVQLDNHKAAFTVTSTEPCLNESRVYYNTSTGYNTVAWDFGDGTTSTALYPGKSFTAPGTYDIKLKITSPSGCVDETTQKVRVPDPKADFVLPETLLPCPPANVTLTNTSIDFIRSRWDFGDGTNTGNNNPDGHIYSRPGTYNIVLTVYTREGCSNQISKSITIDGPNGTATAGPDHGCAPLEMNMTATATKTVKYAWDFDDGLVEITTTPQSPKHIYANGGIYTPRVILIDAKGCEVPAIINDKVIVDKPVADFSIDNSAACGGGLVRFTNLSKTLTEEQLGMPLSSTWDFGMPGNPGNTSTIRHPSFNYPNPGKHAINLKIVTAYGCTAEATKELTIPTQPRAAIDPIGDICQGFSTTITGHEITGQADAKWQWNIAPDINTTQQTPISYEANIAGIKPVQLTVTNADGSCPDVAGTQFTVQVSPLLAPTPNKVNVCRGTPLQLMANSEANATVLWTNYNISDPTSHSPLVTPDRDTSYTVTATNPYGCTNTKIISLTVTQPITVQTTDGVICDGTSTRLMATGADRYQWTPAATLSDANIPDPIARPTVSTDYTVTGQDKYNCFTASAVSHVIVHTSPTVNAGPDITTSNGSIIPMRLELSEDVTTVRWTPQDGLSCSVCANTTITPKNDATYYIEVTNRYGCTAKDELNLKIVCDNANIFIPNSFSPNRDGVNDIFYIRGRGAQEVKSFKIFNRWGQLVYERYSFTTNDSSKGWDGTFKGQAANPDVYVYFTEVVCDKGGAQLLKGNITLLK